jgi:hypothetical protein
MENGTWVATYRGMFKFGDTKESAKDALAKAMEVRREAFARLREVAR